MAVQAGSLIANVVRTKYNVGKRTARFPLLFTLRPGGMLLPPITTLADGAIEAVKVRRERREAGKPIKFGEGLLMGVQKTRDVFGGHIETVLEELKKTKVDTDEGPGRKITDVLREGIDDRRKTPVIGDKRAALTKVRELRQRRVQHRKSGGLLGFGIIKKR